MLVLEGRTGRPANKQKLCNLARLLLVRRHRAAPGIRSATRARTITSWSAKRSTSVSPWRPPPEGDPIQLTNIVIHPAGPTLAVAVAGNVKNSVFGIDWGGSGLSGFSNAFAWTD